MKEKLELKRRLVYSILTTPIIVIEKIEHKEDAKIYFKDGAIFSTQLYVGTEDPDMSDFAVGFYEILYDELLKKTSEGIDRILNDDHKFINDKFAGDTMNSFNIIAKMIDGLDKEKRKNVPLNEYPDILQKYYNSYHCLANFWLIPMEHGRKSCKLNSYDSLDLYLNKVEEGWGDFKEKGYFREFKNFDEFKKVHYVDVLKRDDETIKDWYKQKDTGKELIEWAINNILARARAITQDDKMTEALYGYFKEKDFLKNFTD